MRKVRILSLIPVFAALTAAGAFIRVPVGPVPVTMQNLFTVMAGMLLGPGAGAASQAVYVAMGLLGLPVFSGGGGPAYVMSPTFGYLVGFIAAAAVSGFIAKDKELNTRNAFLASAAGMLAVYLVGLPYLAFYFHFIMKKPDAAMLAVKVGIIFQATGRNHLVSF
jgi:biotin transport system substrate-specific component